MAIKFFVDFFKTVDFQVGTNILQDAPDHTIFVKKFWGSMPPDPPPP